jgi:hypothetical protein
MPVLLVLTLLGVGLAYQVDTIYRIDAGNYFDRPFLRGFHDREDIGGTEPFRWTGARAEVRFPGVGAQDRWLLVRLGGHEYPGLADRVVTVEANGREIGRIVVRKGWQEYRFWIPAALQQHGSLRVVLETEPFVPASVVGGEDDRLVGVKASRVELVPMRSGLALGWPASVPLLASVVVATGVYLGLAMWVLRPVWAAAFGLLISAALSWALAAHRLQAAAYLPRLAGGTLLGLLLVPLLGVLARQMYRWSGVAAAPWALRTLQGMFLIGFWLKAWGLLYPTSVAIDLKWHLFQAQRIVDGELAALYRPGALAFWITPEQWSGGAEAAVPYTPFYHLTAAAFFFLPWPPYVTANLLSVFLDTSRGFLIFGLARKLGMSERAGVFGALLYSLLPVTFLLHSWGNVPTTTGLWWALAATWYLVGGWEKLARWQVGIGLTLLLLGTMLYYSVTAAFIVVFLVILLLGLMPSSGSRTRSLGAIALALAAAFALAIAIYYWQYIPAFLLLVRTGKLAAGLAETGERVPVPLFLWQTVSRLASVRYGLLWPALLAVAGAWLGRARLRDPLVRWLTLSWLLTGLLFFAVDYWVQLVDKHIFFLAPLWALWGGVALDWLAGRRLPGKAALWATYLTLAGSALYTWVYRLSYVRQEWSEIDVRIVGERLAPFLAQGVARLFGL